MAKTIDVDSLQSFAPETRLVLGGRDPVANHGFVNPAVHHVSTVLYPSVEDFIERRARYLYGRRGTPTSEALENALRDIEGARCRGVALLPSGLAAISTALLAVLNAGDHVLVTDNAYQPTRKVCDGFLKRMGIATTYYDPLVGADIATLMRENTRAVFVEAPGSLTFEVQDVPAICAVARDRGAITVLDNTWATPLHFRAFDHGVDVAVHAATKYIGGHSDVLLGAIVANEKTYPALFRLWTDLGVTASSDDCFLGLRGLRTLAVRLAQQQKSAMQIAQYLLSHPAVKEVIYPALPGSRGHEIWKRDFKGASSLFAVVLHPVAEEKIEAMLNSLELFAMGFSWGGFESLIIPTHPEKARAVTVWSPGGPCLRLAIGLEDPEDLIADLASGLARLA